MSTLAQGEGLTTKSKYGDWQTAVTKYFAAGDKANAQALFDEFVEVMSGYRNEKVQDNFAVHYKRLTDSTAEAFVIKFRDWVCHKLPDLIYEQETDLMNLKDEILANTNRLLYLMRLK